MDVFAFIALLVRIGTAVAKIIEIAGEGAADVRLGDIPGFGEWKSKVITPDFTKLHERFNDLKNKP